MTDPTPTPDTAEGTPEDQSAPHPYGEVGSLVLDLVTASTNATFATMDSLYEGERTRRLALEVHIEDALDAFAHAFGGTVREYETAVALLRRMPYGPEEAEKAARHRESAAT